MYRRFSGKHCGGDGFPALKSSDPRSVMSLIRTKDGAPRGMGTNTGAYTIIGRGRSAFSNRDGRRISIRPPSVSVVWQLSPLSGRKAAQTIEFHNTPDRCRLFPRAIKRDANGPRRRSAGDRFALAKKQRMSMLKNLLFLPDPAPRCAQRHEAQQRPSGREDTKGALCVVDLDTVMPGSSLFDFGDAPSLRRFDRGGGRSAISQRWK